VHLHIEKLPVEGEWLVELRDGERAVHDSLGPCLAAGCDTMEEAVEVFVDSFGCNDYEIAGDEFATFAAALVRGVETDAELQARLDVLEGEFSG
jgi:hypothetical protein